MSAPVCAWSRARGPESPKCTEKELAPSSKAPYQESDFTILSAKPRGQAFPRLCFKKALLKSHVCRKQVAVSSFSYSVSLSAIFVSSPMSFTPFLIRAKFPSRAQVHQRLFVLNRTSGSCTSSRCCMSSPLPACSYVTSDSAGTCSHSQIFLFPVCPGHRAPSVAPPFRKAPTTPIYLCYAMCPKHCISAPLAPSLPSCLFALQGGIP